MKALLIAILLATSTQAFGEMNLPQLHSINRVMLAAPYSCQGDYRRSALFLSSYSKERNSPELLYNGACGSQNYIQGLTAGDDFALVADLGEIPIEVITASDAFNSGTILDANAFKEYQPVKQNHSYVVLISKAEIRSLFVIKVLYQVKDGPMVFDYAVKSYSIQSTRSESPGFSWSARNH